MNSQITLVDPVAFQHQQAHTVLQFDVNSVHNTTISLLNGSSLCYVVESNKHASLTKITRVVDCSEPIVAGIIERSDLIPDKVTLHGQNPVRIGAWLRSSMFSYLWVFFSAWIIYWLLTNRTLGRQPWKLEDENTSGSWIMPVNRS